LKIIRGRKERSKMKEINKSILNNNNKVKNKNKKEKKEKKRTIIYFNF
jgi:hypothetical protein